MREWCPMSVETSVNMFGEWIIVKDGQSECVQTSGGCGTIKGRDEHTPTGVLYRRSGLLKICCQ